jgi:hypothetical protein
MSWLGWGVGSLLIAVKPRLRSASRAWLSFHEKSRAAMCNDARQDNENLYLVYSDDLYTWDGETGHFRCRTYYESRKAWRCAKNVRMSLARPYAPFVCDRRNGAWRERAGGSKCHRLAQNGVQDPKPAPHVFTWSSRHSTTRTAGRCASPTIAVWEEAWSPVKVSLSSDMPPKRFAKHG